MRASMYVYIYVYGGSWNGGFPNGWFMDNPTKMDDLGVALFNRKPPYMYVYIYIYAQRLGFAQAFIRGIPFPNNRIYIYICIYIYMYESRSKWLKATLVLQELFLSQMRTKACKAIGPPPKAIPWDCTFTEPAKLMPGIQPVVPCFLQLPNHLVSNSLALFLSFFLSFVRSFVRYFFVSFFFFSLSLSLSLSPLCLAFSFSRSPSLSLCRFCGKFPSNNVLCSTGYLAIT